MNNEIKEILDRWERIDHKEYSCGFEFADSGSFDEDCRCFEERKKMANYITNLQQENKKQKEIIDKIMNLIKQYGKYDGKKCTRGFQMWSADFNKILDILKEVSEWLSLIKMNF